MNIKELRKLTKEELLKKKKECKYLIFGSSAKIKPLIKPEQVKNVKKTIARINTLLNVLNNER